MFLKLMATVSYNRQLRVKLAIIFGLAQVFAIPSGFGRSRIRRNCGYTLLCVGFFHSVHLFSAISLVTFGCKIQTPIIKNSISIKFTR